MKALTRFCSFFFLLEFIFELRNFYCFDSFTIHFSSIYTMVLSAFDPSLVVISTWYQFTCTITTRIVELVNTSTNSKNFMRLYLLYWFIYNDWNSWPTTQLPREDWQLQQVWNRPFIPRFSALPPPSRILKLRTPRGHVYLPITFSCSSKVSIGHRNVPLHTGVEQCSTKGEQTFTCSLEPTKIFLMAF
jgi:hypothetical protein